MEVRGACTRLQSFVERVSRVGLLVAMSDDTRLTGKPAIVHKNEDAWEGGALRCLLACMFLCQARILAMKRFAVIFFSPRSPPFY